MIRHGETAWSLIGQHTVPGGEMPDQVGGRADLLIPPRATEGTAALFAHGHLLRVLVARWLGLPTSEGQYFLLNAGTLSVPGYYHGIPAVKTWNGPLGD